MDVIIVCHTELGHVEHREVIYDKCLDGVLTGVPNLIKLADRYGAKVSFAVMPEVAEYFPEKVHHEVGLHVHPGWNEHYNGTRSCIGDRYLKEHCRQSINSIALRDYPYEEQLDMIKAGRDYLSDVLRVDPEIFVAGSVSVDNSTIRALIKAGFTHDISPVPRSCPGVYDWGRLSRICMPYHPGETDYQQAGDLPILLVPNSMAIGREYVNPEVITVFGLPWLKACFREYYTQKLPLFNIHLHSPCMTDPYYVRAMDRLMSFISKHDVTFKFASEIRRYDPVAPGPKVLPYLFGINKDLLASVAKKVTREVMSHTQMYLQSNHSSADLCGKKHA